MSKPKVDYGLVMLATDKDEAISDDDDNIIVQQDVVITKSSNEIIAYGSGDDGNFRNVMDRSEIVHMLVDKWNQLPLSGVQYVVYDLILDYWGEGSAIWLEL